MRMPFGKHKGEDLSQIPRSYLRWILENVERLDYGLRRAIEAMIAVNDGAELLQKLAKQIAGAA